MPATAVEIEYRAPGTPVPAGPIARAWVAPLPYWLACALMIAPLVMIDLLISGFDAASYYLFPILHLLFGGPILLVCLAIRAWLRHEVVRRHGMAVRPEYFRIIAGLALAAAYLLAGPMSLRIGAIVRWSALESLRVKLEQGTLPPGKLDFMPFEFTGAEVFGNGVVILYTDGKAGYFAGSGSGLIYVPEGDEFPSYNRGSDGWLVGRWYWFTTD